MLNELELTDDMVQEGLAFAKLMEDERQWNALTSLLRRLNEDAIARWSEGDGDKYTKKWLRGYREALMDITARIVQQANDSAAYVEAKREGERQIRLSPDNGSGTGDLAIA